MINDIILILKKNKHIRDMNQKSHFEEIVSMFTDNQLLREYCGITEAEVKMCKKAFIENKLFGDTAISGKVKPSQVKEMAFAPFKKVINKIFKQIYESQDYGNIKKTYDSIEQDKTYIGKRELESITVDSIAVSERTKKVLKENGITTVNKLTDLDFNELKLSGNYGVKTIFELQQLAGKLKDSRDILSILRKSGK